MRKDATRQVKILARSDIVGDFANTTMRLKEEVFATSRRSSPLAQVTDKYILARSFKV